MILENKSGKKIVVDKELTSEVLKESVKLSMKVMLNDITFEEGVEKFVEISKIDTLIPHDESDGEDGVDLTRQVNSVFYNIMLMESNRLASLGADLTATSAKNKETGEMETPAQVVNRIKITLFPESQGLDESFRDETFGADEFTLEVIIEKLVNGIIEYDEAWCEFYYLEDIGEKYGVKSEDEFESFNEYRRHIVDVFNDLTFKSHGEYNTNLSSEEWDNRVEEIKIASVNFLKCRETKVEDVIAGEEIADVEVPETPESVDLETTQGETEDDDGLNLDDLDDLEPEVKIEYEKVRLDKDGNPTITDREKSILASGLGISIPTVDNYVEFAKTTKIQLDETIANLDEGEDYSAIENIHISAYNTVVQLQKGVDEFRDVVAENSKIILKGIDDDLDEMIRLRAEDRGTEEVYDKKATMWGILKSIKNFKVESVDIENTINSISFLINRIDGEKFTEKFWTKHSNSDVLLIKSAQALYYKLVDMNGSIELDTDISAADAVEVAKFALGKAIICKTQIRPPAMIKVKGRELFNKKMIGKSATLKAAKFRFENHIALQTFSEISAGCVMGKAAVAGSMGEAFETMSKETPAELIKRVSILSIWNAVYSDVVELFEYVGKLDKDCAPEYIMQLKQAYISRLVESVDGTKSPEVIAQAVGDYVFGYAGYIADNLSKFMD